MHGLANFKFLRWVVIFLSTTNFVASRLLSVSLLFCTGNIPASCYSFSGIISYLMCCICPYFPHSLLRLDEIRYKKSAHNVVEFLWILWKSAEGRLYFGVVVNYICGCTVKPCDILLSCGSQSDGTQWCSWLRHCATSRKVAGSYPHVTEIFPSTLWPWGWLSL